MTIAEVRNREQSQASEGGNVARLAAAAKAGDRASFETLVGLFHPALFRMIYYRTRSRMDAEDLTQETFMKAFSHIETLKEADRFRPWLYRIALNRVRDFYRKRRILVFFGQNPKQDDPDVFPEPAEGQDGALRQVMRNEFWQRLNRFLDRLGRWEREVFLLRFLDGLSIREISLAIDKNESTVKTHLYRGVAKFKRDEGILEIFHEGQVET